MNPDLLVLEMAMLDTNIDDDELFEESAGGIYGFATKVINLLQKLLINMKAYFKTMKSDFDILVAKVEQKNETKRLMKLLKEPDGEKIIVQFPNVQKAILLYQEGLTNLQRKLKKIVKRNYADFKKDERKNLDYMIDDFEDSIDAFEEGIEDALKDTVKKKGKEALKYMEDNKRSASTVYRYYFNLMRQYEAFKIEAERQLKIKDINNELGEYDTNGRILRLFTKLSSKLSKASSRILVKMVYFTV